MRSASGEQRYNTAECSRVVSRHSVAGLTLPTAVTRDHHCSTAALQQLPNMLRSLACVSSEVRLASVPASECEANYPVRVASDDTGIVTESIGEYQFVKHVHLYIL